MKTILCLFAGLCLLAVVACNDKGGPPKKFGTLDPEEKPGKAEAPKVDVNKKLP